MSDKNPKSLIQVARQNGVKDEVEPLDLGARVRELRKARDWTLERAATEAGLARSTLSKIENGQMSPTYDALRKLAEGLQISVPQLFTPPQRDFDLDRGRIRSPEFNSKSNRGSRGSERGAARAKVETIGN